MSTDLLIEAIERLEDAIAEAKETTRECHAARKDLLATKKEIAEWVATSPELGQRVSEFVESVVVKAVTEQYVGLRHDVNVVLDRMTRRIDDFVKDPAAFARDEIDRYEAESRERLAQERKDVDSLERVMQRTLDRLREMA